MGIRLHLQKGDSFLDIDVSTWKEIVLSSGVPSVPGVKGSSYSY